MNNRTIPSLRAAHMLLAVGLLVLGVAMPVAAAQRCEITFRATGAEPLGGLKARIGYASAGGAFVGAEENVQCVALAPGAYSAARNDTAGKQLLLGLISAIGVTLPQDLWRCTFDSDADVPSPAGFPITIDDAITSLGAPTSAVVTVDRISCSTQAVCGNGSVELGEECDTAGATIACDASCKLTRDSQRCKLGFQITGTGTLGGIQFKVDYAGANGAFQGAGTAVACTEAIASGLSAVEDRDSQKQLALAFISPSGLTLPTALWKCVFVTNATPLITQNFQFGDIIATNVLTEDLAVQITATATECIYGPYCGDGKTDPTEICDDGNRIGTDACTNACQPAVCGDGATWSGVEQCDDGNSILGDCCSNSCTYESSVTICRAANGVCDIAETCTGSSGGCPSNQFQSPSTACTTDANPCTNDQCDGNGSCGHTPNSSACSDGLFCNGADSCAGGSCIVHPGNPCPGPDMDANCKESCAESTDTCTANDPELATCNDSNPQTLNDRCVSGTCVGSTGATVCGDADANGSIAAGDALRVLRAAVGDAVSCPSYRCDTDNSGSISSSDALRVLRKAVGQNVTLTCPVSPA